MQTDLCNSTKHFNGFLTEREICVASREMEASNVSALVRYIFAVKLVYK